MIMLLLNYNLIMLSRNCNRSMSNSMFKQRKGNYVLNEMIPHVAMVVTCLNTFKIYQTMRVRMVNFAIYNLYFHKPDVSKAKSVSRNIFK